jgi:uncharacterized protein
MMIAATGFGEFMATEDLDRFLPGVGDQLKVYVYRLIDPRNGETFYVGKGTGDRVFAHVREEVAESDSDGLSNKLKRIREIRLAGFDVAHVIHRHGLDSKTADEVEAALIDAYPGLTNAVGGSGSNDYGVMHAKEIIARYCAPEAEFQHKALLISVNREATERSPYEAVRYAWKISPANASQAEVILATVRGVIKGAFIAHQWLKATPENFPGRWSEGDGSADRYGFVGEEAPPKIANLYVGKRVPDRFRKRGAANPIKYTWK